MFVIVNWNQRHMPTLRSKSDAMSKVWNDHLYPDNEAVYPDAEQWQTFREKILTEKGGLAAGFRSEMVLHGYNMIGQMTGKISFIQGWVLALTGRMPDRQQDRLLNAISINTALTDPRFWIFRSPRLGATVKSSPAACLSSGILTNEGEMIGSGASYHAATFFQKAKQAIESGQSVEDVVRETFKQQKIIHGYGRVLARGSDERNPPLLKVAKETGQDQGDYLKLAFEVEKTIQQIKHRDIYLNSGGLVTALLMDMAFSPLQVSMFYMLVFSIGMGANIVEAYEQQPGKFLPLTDDDIEYVGKDYRPLPIPLPQQIILEEINDKRVVAMDSVSFLTEANAGDIVITGSHGGKAAAEHCRNYPLAALIFHDAGMGKENAGISCLDILEQQGIASASVSADSARIGEADDIYQHGIISACNKIAGAKYGITPGETVKQSVKRILSR